MVLGDFALITGLLTPLRSVIDSPFPQLMNCWMNWEELSIFPSLIYSKDITKSICMPLTYLKLLSKPTMDITNLK